MTALISAIAGQTADYTPRRLDLVVWRGDDLVLPFTLMDSAKEVTDGVVVAGSGNLSSVSAPWVSGDVGKAIVGDHIPFGSMIGTFTDASHVILDNGATATENKTFARLRWGNASDMSAAAFSAQVRSHPDTSAAAASFTIDATQSVDGLLTLTMATGITKNLRIGRYVWDLQRVLAGVRKTLLAGAFIVDGDATRP